MSLNFTKSPVSIQLVVWNHIDVLADTLSSLFRQTYPYFSVRVFDNGSQDGSCAFIQKHYPHITLLRHAHNLGFGAAHNQGIRYALERWQHQDLKHTYILTVSPGMILAPDCLEQLVKTAEQQHQAGSVGGKYLRAYGEHMQDEALKNVVCSDVLESAGVFLRRNGTYFVRGAGEMYSGQYEQEEEVFAADVSLALYRVSALVQIQHQQHFFDQDFFWGGEGFDLAWRLQWCGWTCWYTHLAKAYQYKGRFRAASQKRLPQACRSAARQEQFYLWRNHFFSCLKNFSVLDFFVCGFLFPWPWIKFLFQASFSFKLWSFLKEVIYFFPSVLKKRRQIVHKRVCSALQMRKKFL